MSFFPECPIFKQKVYDDVFKKMEEKHLTRADQDRKENTDLLKEIIEKKFISLMKRDQLFQLIFDRVDVGGSYYKGTKYGKPDEVKLHLVHKLGNINSTLNRKKPRPKFTVKFTNSNYKEVDVKLVSAFEFNSVQLNSSYQRYNENKLPFRVTLKPFHGYGLNSDLYWRLSFLENEKDTLRDEVRPVIKLIKKLRDAYDLKSITGNQIETIFFHEMFKYRSDLIQFLGASKTYLFIHGRKELLAALEKRYLASFWNSAYSLIDSSDPDYYDQVSRLRNILDGIDSKIEEDPDRLLYVF
uniref:Mab-21-like nucleotidyltransferase domain-containing protein n=1 Tax=Trichogramma kaykai TaxID=54128 RepID=A0ABD2XM21_9HYME